MQILHQDSKQFPLAPQHMLRELRANVLGVLYHHEITCIETSNMNQLTCTLCVEEFTSPRFLL